MKKTLSLVAVITLLTNITCGSVNIFNNPNKQRQINNSQISNDLAKQYAQETSIVPKSLLIATSHGFSTNSLLSNLHSKLDNPITHITVPQTNNANAFIDSLTTNNLDLSTINNIQQNFQAQGVNQKAIDDVNNKIGKYNNYKNYTNQILANFNNETLSNDQIPDFLDTLLRDAKTSFPEVTKYLSYVKYQKLLTLVINELTTDWDQQATWGNSPIEAMKNYIHSKKGDIAQAKNAGSKGEWHYALVQAQKYNWDWNNFYEYMAGANLNYMFKILSDKYIGDLINNRLHLGPWNWGFDSDGFISDLNNAIAKFSITPDAWQYLVKAIVPMIKIKILKLKDPILSVNDLTWTNQSPQNKTVALKQVLEQLTYLLSPQGKNDLINLFDGLLNGPFANDIVIDFGIFGYYTLAEAFSAPGISFFVSSHDLATQIVDALTKLTDPLNLATLINKIITFSDKYLTKNPDIDLKNLAGYLSHIFNEDFTQALNEMLDIINNPTESIYNAADILKLLGIQKNQKDFKTDSPLYWLQKSLIAPDSSIKQILSIWTSADNTGIIDNMIKEQQDFLNDNYYKFFDIDNQTQFHVTNIIVHQSTNIINLSYNLIDVVNNVTYHLIFISKEQNHQKFLLERFEI